MGYRHEGSRLLLVDDEKSILESMKLLLGDYGHRVSTAQSAEEARRAMMCEEFDIVFVDQFLGRTRGIELMQELGTGSLRTSFVIITANGTTDLAVESMRKGAADFVSKPFTAADLIRSIEYVRKKQELEQQRQEMLSALAEDVDRKTQEIQRLFYGILSSFAQAMEKRDFGTYGHCRRVSQYTGLIAAALDIGGGERDGLRTAATLHDIGKIGISDGILGKSGPLTVDEWDVVKSHPARGVEILSPIRQFSNILPGILYHHERYDGSGYPHGLAADEIPLPARIIAVADTYDAILSERPYRSAAGRERAISELNAGAGAQFDPQIVHAFVEADERYHEMFGSGKQW